MNKAITIAKKTIDPKLIERLNNSFEKFHRLNMGKQGAFTGSFNEDFWKQVYTVNAKNNESLDFEIFYFKTMYSIFQKEAY